MSPAERDCLEGDIIDPHTEITIVQLSRRCRVEVELVMQLVDEGIVEPVRRSDDTLYFAYASTTRVRMVRRLQRDLGVNLPGAALAIELLDRIRELESRL
jgi:chaperone modulatory protein CbpM